MPPPERGRRGETWRASGGVEGDRLVLRTASEAEAALAALAETTEAWEGAWEREGSGGRLALPVQGGLRQGVVQVQASAHPVTGGSELVLRTEAAHWELRRSAVTLLVVALLGALAATLWPFVPALQSLPPLGLLLAVAAWLAVLTRLRHKSVREFLDDVESRLEPLDEEPAGTNE